MCWYEGSPVSETHRVPAGEMWRDKESRERRYGCGGAGGGRCGESHTCMTPEGGRGPGGDLWEEPPGQKEQGEQWSRSSIMPVMLKDQQDQVSDAE